VSTISVLGEKPTALRKRRPHARLGNKIVFFSILISLRNRYREPDSFAVFTCFLVVQPWRALFKDCVGF
jgi:hypothetical protein